MKSKHAMGWLEVILWSALLIVVLALMSGCAEMLVRPELDASVNYQRDIRFKVESLTASGKWGDGITFEGTGVIHEAPAYRITVYPPGKADMITISTCHREEKTADPEKNGWFKSGYPFVIKPVLGVETKGACNVFDIGIYEKKAGRHGWGMLIVQTPRETLPAITKCNGAIKRSTGVSDCQAKKGLLQEYIFTTPVEVATTMGCEIRKPVDGIRWEFLMPPGPCVVYFIDSQNPDRFHQAHMYGYDTSPIRGVD